MQIIQKIAESPRTITYRIEYKDSTAILKVFNIKQYSLSDFIRFKQEYEIIMNPDISGIVKPYEFIDTHEGFGIVVEDFDSISLKDLLMKKKIVALNEFFTIAIKVSQIVGTFHQYNIVHQDIKPSNILLTEDLHTIKITDFGIRTLFPNEYQEIYRKDIMEGTLLYMSPEQTGRLNRNIDYRTDIYSMGITFYELLTGNVPFKSDDPIEIIYAHIARKPVPVSEVNPHIPGIVSQIIDKMLAKTPEERYQNSFGIVGDLIQCNDEYTKKGTISPFKIASFDIPLRFNIPQQIVGRDSEIQSLLSSYKNFMEGHREIVIVKGSPGIGKSALVNEIYKPITATKGYFISGKYDQFKRDIPYSSIIQSFQMLIRQILTEDLSKLELWKEELLNAFGKSGKILTDVIPDLEHIIGPQLPVEQLSPEESQNRFNYLFKKFINVFAVQEHPVVLFLDDVQWIDLASLNLIRSIVLDESVKNFFLIMAYRDNEIDASHPINPVMHEIKDNGVTINIIALAPLKEEDVNTFLLNFLSNNVESTMELSSLIYSKTAGNPFFIIQFLKRLFEDKLITFSPEKGWIWNIEKVKELPITDNVVDMLSQSINKMPAENIELLTICACIGNRFELEDIIAITGETAEAILKVMNSLIEFGFIGLFKNIYRFYHDRIQEAAYSLLDEEERSKLHYKIGKNSLSKTAKENIQDKIFYIVYHLNKSVHLIQTVEERIQLAELNLIAGEKAKNSSAFDSSLIYFKQAAELLPENAWIDYYRLTFKIYLNYAESEYLAGDQNNAATLFDVLSHYAQSRLDKAEIYINRCLFLTNGGQYEEAVRLGLEGLKMFGISIPEKPSMLNVIKVMLALKIKLQFIKPEDLLQLPWIENPEEIAVIRIFESVTQAGYYTSRNLVIIGPIILFNFIIKTGNCYLSSYLFSVLAGIVGPGLGDYKWANQFYQLSMKLLDKTPEKNACSVYFTLAYLYLHWNAHVQENIVLFRKSYNMFLGLGKFDFAAHSINNIADYSFILGKNLDEIFTEYKNYEKFFKNQKDKFFHSYYEDNIRKYYCYKGLTDSPSTYNIHDNYTEERLQAVRQTKNNLDKFIFVFNLMKIEFLYRNLQKGYEYAREIEPIKNELVGNIHYPEFVLYYLLLLAGLRKDKKISKIIWAMKSKLLVSMMKKWSTVCPFNYLHKYYLMLAEKYAVTKNYKKAKEYYDKAISEANRNGYIFIEAIAHECLGSMYISLNDKTNASQQLEKAYNLFHQCGADAKATMLHNNYRDKIKIEQTRTAIAIDSDSSSIASSLDIVDFSSALKASLAIAGELNFEKLPGKLLSIMIENAGAEKGFLILKDNEDLIVVARKNTIDEEITALENLPVDRVDGFSHAIVRLVARTGEKVIINDAMNDPFYVNDEHIFKNKVKSLLCLPILNQGKVVAVLYLENNVITAAFTQRHIALLTLISSQAAISIENAQLYLNLEKKVEERTKELKEARDALWGEMQLAAKIQTVLLPKSPMAKGYEIYGYMIPATEVGGDYYDVINTSTNDWIIIGDVSGHGVSAGLVMMMVQTAIQTIIRANPNLTPVTLLKVVNRTITYNIKQMNEDKYMTITALKLYPEGKVEYSGLHQYILVYRYATKQVDRMESDGLWLGFDIDLNRDTSLKEFTMNKGDVFLLYTDGITEAKTDNGEMFEEDQLANLLQNSGEKPLAEIKNDIIAALRNYHTNDDVTMVLTRKV